MKKVQTEITIFDDTNRSMRDVKEFTPFIVVRRSGALCIGKRSADKLSIDKTNTFAVLISTTGTGSFAEKEYFLAVNPPNGCTVSYNKHTTSMLFSHKKATDNIIGSLKDAPEEKRSFKMNLAADPQEINGITCHAIIISSAK